MSDPQQGHHTTSLRVRYCECDPMGVAHHASYLPWLEIGRTEMLRASGRSYASLEREGVLLVIVKIEVKYRRPVRYDEVIEIRTRLTGSSRVKLEHAYEVTIVERDGQRRAPAIVEAEGPAAVASTTLASVARDGRPLALPEWLTA
jgi:acyl-CoA thioester hydrolase